MALTSKAARVLTAETDIGAETLVKLLYERDPPTGPSVDYRLPAGTTVVVDESGMVCTASLRRS